MEQERKGIEGWLAPRPMLTRLRKFSSWVNVRDGDLSINLARDAA